MSLISGNRIKECKYVYELPYTERKYLCNILDINDQWEKLGGEKMGFSVLELNEIRRAERCGESPTDRLLQHWGRKNNTILTLYFHLYSIEHFQAMSVLLPFIPIEYHFERLHDQIQTKLQSSDSKREEVAAAFPKPDPSLLVDLRPRNESKMMPRDRGDILDSKYGVAPQHPYTQGQSIPDHNLRHVPQPTGEGNRSNHSKEKIPETFLASGAKAVQTQFPLAHELGASIPAGRNPEPPSIKILNTTAPPRTSKYPTYSSNENNVEANNNDQPSKEPLKKYKQKVKVDPGGVKKTLSEGGSDEREEPIQPPQKGPTVDASRKRYQSNCSEFSTLSECGVPMISYKELEDATVFWNRGQLLGSGGFGSVYKGSWINVIVAVKRINTGSQTDGTNSGSSPINQIMDELRFLQKYRHDNILPVYGFSADPGKPHCLVYQFMPNGSLEYRLQCRKIEAFSESVPLPLNWRQRLMIARGTAAALEFLHTVLEKPLIHGDVKSANILLDRSLEPKLGDFGLAREGPQSDFTSMKVSHVHGTRPYIPEEYLRGKKLSTKVDTYSFGIVLFEICSGRRAYNDRTRKFLKEEVLEETDRYALRDKKAGLEGVKVFDVLFDIGLECINRIPKKRPDMPTVSQDLKRFEKILEEQDRHRRHTFEDSQPGHPPIVPSPITFPSISTSPSFPYALSPHPYVPTPPHPFSAFPLRSSALPCMIPSLTPPWMQGLSPNPPPVPPTPPNAPPTSPREERGVSPPLCTPLPDLSRLLVLNSVEVLQRLSESVSESFSTEGEVNLEMDDSRDSQSEASIEGGLSPSHGAHANTVTKVCIPLLTQLGIHQREDPGGESSECGEKQVVSAQGKKSLLD